MKLSATITFQPEPKRNLDGVGSGDNRQLNEKVGAEFLETFPAAPSFHAKPGNKAQRKSKPIRKRKARTEVRGDSR